MAQHDYVLDNQSGAEFRADLNNALSAIVSQNSGAFEPTTTYAYMLWADTTSNQLKQRNAANTDWVVLQELDGTLLMENGTENNPGLAFASDKNTGFYRAGADKLGISTGGSTRILIDDQKQVLFGTTTGTWSSRAVFFGDTIFGTQHPTVTLAYGSANPTDDTVVGDIYFNDSSAGSPGAIIRATADGNWGTYQPTRIEFWVSSASAGAGEVMRIDKDGNVGIGTANAGSRLEVKDTSSSSITIRAASGASNYSNILFRRDGSSGDTRIRSDVGNNTIEFINAASERLRITSDGKLGLGTSSPDAGRLVITSSSNGGIGGSIVLENSNNSDTDKVGIALRPNGSATTAIGSYGEARIISEYVSGSTNGANNLQFWTHSGNGTVAQAIHIDSSQRVGIGTTAPGYPLTVVSDVSSQTLKICGRSSDNISNVAFSSNNQGTDYAFLTGAPTYLAASVNGSEVFRVDSSRRLLVGTSSTSGLSSSSLQVVNSGGTCLEVIRNVNDAGGANIYLTKSRGTLASPTEVSNSDSLGAILFNGYDGSTYQNCAEISAHADGTWTDGGDTTDNPSRLVFSTTADGASSPTERMTIDSRGQMIVQSDGTPTVDHVITTVATASSNGLLSFRRGATLGTLGTGTEVCRVARDGDLTNTNNSYGSLSDIKLKENIIDANSQWNDLKALQVRKYNFKEKTGHETHTQIGLIAQEVELVSPGLVSESPDRDEDGNDLGTVTKSVNYSVLYMKAVKALQEAMERIETLEAKVAALEAS